MKFSSSSVLASTAIALSFSSVAFAHDDGVQYANNKRHAAYLARQAAAISGTATTTGSSSHTTSAVATGSGSSSSAVATGTATTTGAASGVTTSVRATGTSTSTIDGNAIPPLSEITSGMPIQGTVTMYTTYAAGATGPVSGAPPLPTIAIKVTDYPALDTVPPTNSSEVQGWLKSIDTSKFPSISQTKDGSCLGDPAAAADKSRCWWTCGGCLRETDISTCPDKLSWGISYDDGPSPYTPKLLNYLNEKQLKATFFVVGSRVISRPQILQTEYMAGHEISVHTWSHHPLTTLTNEQIVAELGWTKKAIHDVLGVTPLTFRPPYGDLDDRVRAVAAAMGLTPIQWTGTGANEFDTDDWKIPGGTATGQSSLDAFNKILGLASSLTTGFIVLEHDLYQQTVDMAIGYFLPLAASHNPVFKPEPIYECLHKPLTDVYLETSTNKSDPAVGANHSASSMAAKATTTEGAQGAGTGGNSNGANALHGRGAMVGTVLSLALVAVGAALLA